MIVVDTNVLAYLVIESEHTATAAALREAEPSWAAPRLWRSELANVLSLYVRQGTMSMGSAIRRHGAAEALVGGAEYDVDVERVLATAAAGPCSAYDAEFVALAEDLGVPLVTADRRLTSAFPSRVRLLGDAA
ncbi:MAG: type II toxin-antitoxin system VapC family toxin [Bacteroidota bacterium]